MDTSAALVLPLEPGISHGEPRQDLDRTRVSYCRAFWSHWKAAPYSPTSMAPLPPGGTARMAVPGGGAGPIASSI